MRKIYSLFMSLLMATAVCGQEKNIKVVNVVDGLDAKAFVAALGGADRYEIDSLVLNLSDGFMEEFYGVLRDCCEKGRLRGIDMSGCIALKAIPTGAFMSSYINGKVRKETFEAKQDIRMPLRYISLPKTIRAIGDNAFACSCLEQIDIPTLTVNIGNGAFADCSELKKVVLRGNRRRTADAGGGFSGLPDGAVLQVAEGLGDYYKQTESWGAFGKVEERADIYRAMDVTVGAGTTLEEALGRYDRDVDSLTISGTMTTDDVTFLRRCAMYGRIVDVDMTDCVLDGGSLHHVRLNSLRMPRHMDEICQGFLANSEVETLTLPESYDAIGVNAFKNYQWFADSTLVVPEGCKTVKSYAFQQCGSIKTLMLPYTLEELQYCSLGFRNGRESDEHVMDLYVNRMFPPVYTTEYNSDAVMDPDKEFGPFGCCYAPTTNLCVTRNCRLFVPVGAKANYENDEHWSHIPTIIETPLLTGGTATGISEAVAPAKTSSTADGIYTIDGRLVTTDTTARTMPRGLYVVRSCGTASKVVMGR